ncbi:MAG: Tab2/Atab2 family RNA-binding protein [Cyanobacteria bacterium P01_D01_bin.1]
MSWQLDFYRRPLKDTRGNPLWELLVCDETLAFTYGEFCPQSEANAPWIRRQLEIACDRAGGWPSHIEIFRPQSVSLVEVACRDLPVSVQPKREASALKRWLLQRAAWYPNLDSYTGDAYEPIALDRPAPVPIADHLMGEGWQFATISTDELKRLTYEPIPIQSIPSELMPIRLGLPSTLPIPGVVVDGGRQSMALAQWLQSARPIMLQYIAGIPDGLLLEAGLVDRWIMATFEDEAVAAAARTFTERKIAARGLHFLLVRPDDSGLTYTGLWLLQSKPENEVSRANSGPI